FLILTVSVLPCCSALEVSVPQSQYKVADGEDVSMICNFVPARPVSNIFILKWEAYPDNPDDNVNTVATYFSDNQVDIAPTYEGRAFLEVDIAKQVGTLRLTKVKVEDSRRFQCSVTIPNDDEGTTRASTSLLVLVPPSPPDCTIQGRLEYWQDITITCKSKAGSPKPVTKWQTFSVENVPRAFPPKTTEKDGVLSLFNISRETSGFFVCTSTNEMGSEKCNLTLAVLPASMNIASTAGIIGGVLAGIVVLAIIIYCCRRKAKRPKDAEGSPETVYYDKDGPEVGEPYADKKPNRDRLDDQRDRYGDNRDRLDDQRDRYGGSRDHLDDQRDRYGGSRDRLDDRRDRYGGSRDHLDDPRDRYGGSRDRLDDQRDRYGGSRDRLDDQRDRYGGSRDRLDDQRDRYGGSRDRLDDRRDRYGGSRDRLD
uniref:Ig-like domain-containing protein n=1 Tax=Tetraodon nigroviridis TaxID=99883 RepID=H3D8Q8_TETNG